MFFAPILALVLSAVTLVDAGTVIAAGAKWTDTSGNIIQAHGGGIFKVSQSRNNCFLRLLVTYARVNVNCTEREYILLGGRG